MLKLNDHHIYQIIKNTISIKLKHILYLNKERLLLKNSYNNIQQHEKLIIFHKFAYIYLHSIPKLNPSSWNSFE